MTSDEGHRTNCGPWVRARGAGSPLHGLRPPPPRGSPRCSQRPWSVNMCVLGLLFAAGWPPPSLG